MNAETTLIACALRNLDAARRLTPRIHPLMFESPERGRVWVALARVAERHTATPHLIDAVAAELAADASGMAALRSVRVHSAETLDGAYYAHRVADAYKRRVWRRRIPDADRYDGATTGGSPKPRRIGEPASVPRIRPACVPHSRTAATWCRASVLRPSATLRRPNSWSATWRSRAPSASWCAGDGESRAGSQAASSSCWWY